MVGFAWRVAPPPDAGNLLVHGYVAMQRQGEAVPQHGDSIF